MQGYAKLGGLLKELGCQIVTQNGFANRANKSYAQFENMPARLCRLPKQERPVLAEVLSYPLVLHLNYFCT